MKSDHLDQLFKTQRSKPLIMGIINLDQGSFYPPSIGKDIDEILIRINEMITNGMSILDIGAFTSRPGSSIPTQEIEEKRLFPILTEVCNAFPSLIVSIDTVYAKTAELCINAGVEIINDISGGEFDPELPRVVANNHKILVLMHMKGTPENMMNPEHTQYENVCTSLIHYFKKLMDKYYAMNLSRIIIDPGFGFSKSLSDNYILLAQLSLFKILDAPVLVGLSRKSMIWKPLNLNPETALAGSLAAAQLAAQNGASILRVHDVLETQQVLQVLDLYNNAKLQ